MTPYIPQQAGFIAGDMLAKIGEKHEADKERRKQETGRVKAAEAFLKNLPDDVRGFDTDALAMMSGPDKLGQMIGIIEAQKAKHEQQQTKSLMAALEANTEAGRNTARFPAFAAEMGRFAPPGDLPFDIPEQQFNQFALPEGQTQPGPRELFQALSRTQFNPGNELNQLVNALEQKNSGMSIADAIAAANNAPAGYGKGSLRINPNGTASVDFAPLPPPVPPVNVPPGLDAKSVTVDASGKATTTYGITDRSKALTEAQANALQYSDRMAFNNEVVEGLFAKGFDPTTAGGAVQGQLPNFLTGDMRQQYDAAAGNWVRAVLRKESGAAISKDEQVKAMSDYFPKFGDGPAVVNQKADLRKLAEQNMRRAVGDVRNDPDADAARRIGDVRKAVESGGELDAARAAIRAGKDPAAVKARYKQRTGQPFPE